MLDQEKDAVNGSVAHLKGEMHSLALDLEKAKNRCDELASESTKQEAEKQKYAEALAVAQRQAAEAVKNLANLSRQAGGAGVDGSVGTTVFTAEQLSTQVAVLKGRLACPVCNHRDKKCILMRCRHMFCKHCVDENLKVRWESLSCSPWDFDPQLVCVLLATESKPKVSSMRAGIRRQGCPRRLVVAS